MLNVLIIAGGRGERFWPLSRKNCPKQLLPITSDRPMIVETVDRISGAVSNQNIFISTRQDLASLLFRLLPEISPKNYIIEPLSKNTAPAIGLAAIIISLRYPGSVMAVLPSDHYIRTPEIYSRDLLYASTIAAKTGCLITFGIKPSRPETGYGYIQTGEVIHSDPVCSAYEVKRFIEKPDVVRAEEFVKSGGYLWNSGMFVWTVNAILEAIEKFMPKMYAGLMEIQEAYNTPDFEQILWKKFQKFESVSIDYGVMEKADNTLCIRAAFDWDDVGHWTSLGNIMPQDENGNVVTGDYAGIDTRDCIIKNDSGMVAAIGVKNLIIINTKDAVLVADKSRAQEVKRIIAEIEKKEELKKYL